MMIVIEPRTGRTTVERNLHAVVTLHMKIKRLEAPMLLYDLTYTTVMNIR